MKSFFKSLIVKNSSESEFNFARLAVRVSFFYWVLAMAWIFFSDRIVYLIAKEPQVLNLIQTYKGFFFVSSSALFLYVLLSGRIPLTSINLYQKAKAAEKALFEIENKLKGLSRSNLLGFVVWNNSNSIIEANQEFLRTLGYTFEDLKNGLLQFDQISPKEFQEHDMQVAKELALRGHSKTFEREYIHKNGHRVPVLVGATRYSENGNQSIGFVLDLTELRKTEQEKRQTQERLRLALEATSDCIWEWNLETNETYYSPKWFTMLGYQINEFPANLESWKKLTKPDDVERVIQIVQGCVQNGHGYEAEFQMQAADGKWLWILGCGRVTKWNSAGVPILLSGTNTNITEKKMIQLEAEKMREQLIQAQEIESIGRLAGGVAHDFNNVLTSIIGFAELAKLDQSKNVYLDQIVKSADRGAALTHQLLCYGQRKNLEPEVMRLSELIDRIEPLVRDCLGENILQIENLTENDQIYADPGSIEQVVVNICLNAKDAFSKKENFSFGKMTITFSDVLVDPVQATALSVLQGPYILVKLADDGAGMSQEIQKRIFEPFFTTKPEGTGTGLGLSVCQGIVRQIGGNITVDSQAGVGTTICLYLPKYSSMPIASSSQTQTFVEQTDINSSRIKTILVVEDDDSIREFAYEYLSQMGYQVLVARDGEEALNISTDHIKTIDLLLTDIVMPKIQGIELAKTIQHVRKNIKIIYTSGYLKDFVIPTENEKGRSLFIQKPFRPLELSIAVKKMLDEYPQVPKAADSIS